jgi:hypothetical protein
VLRVPAIVAAGEGRASRAVHGENKAYLEIAGRSLVARVVAALQRVPEVSEVWVVGRPERLEPLLGGRALGAELRKPLTIVPQFRNLLENAWETYRRLLPGAGPEGRDPTPDEETLPVLCLSADLPFATPQEISDFVTKSLETDCDYALGLVTEASMEGFYPEGPGRPGIEMAYFNMREGRFRQSNLHLVRPARLGNRRYIQEMYEHRYQKRFRHALALAWRIASARGGGVRMLWYYALMHLAAVADRRGLRRTADRLRGFVSLAKAESACSQLLQTRFRFVVTEVGGCAVDIDNEADFDASVACFERWSEAQARRAEALLGPLPLPERAGADAPGARIWPRRALP